MTLWYRVLQPFVRWVVIGLLRPRVEGLEHIPASGPAFLVPNHQSILDPILVQAICPRAVDSMTKSTQFSNGIFRWLLPRLHAFPVRRYRTDAQSVRVVLRRLAEGRIVCVYPEGERSWDGCLQPFRGGTLRVLLRAGVPVVPVGIDGTYDVWPRWGTRPRLGATVHLRFGEPLHFGALQDRRAREAALPEAERSLRRALFELSGEAERAAAEALEGRNPSSEDARVEPY